MTIILHPRRTPRDPNRCQRVAVITSTNGANDIQPAVWSALTATTGGKMCKTKKAKVHEVQVGQQGSEDQRNLRPSDESAHSFFLGALSAENPKSTNTAEQIGRSKPVNDKDPPHNGTVPQAHRNHSLHVRLGRKSRLQAKQSITQQKDVLVQRNFLQPTRGGHQFKTLGSCQLYVHHNAGKIKKATFTMTDAPGPCSNTWM